MKSFALSALGLALAVGIVSGCSGSGSENIPVVSSAPPAAAVADDQRIAQSDTLTADEISLVNHANAAPASAPLPVL